MTYLITGGSGSLGRALCAILLANPATTRVIAFARGEHRLAELRRAFPTTKLEVWVGDIRDQDRLLWAFRARPDVVIHAAALKRVEICEDNPDEARKTNIDGTANVVQAAMLADVPRVIVVSSDKSAQPELVYGKTKAAAEAIAIGQNAYRGTGSTRISVARYGNCLDSQGAFLHTLMRCRETGEPVPLTDPSATRFWWTVADAATFLMDVLERMQGAEIWVPRLISSSVGHLASAIAPASAHEIVGMRAPEKSHEVMVSLVEGRSTWACPDCYVILPAHGKWWSPAPPTDAMPVPAGFSLSSDQEPQSVQYVPSN